MISQKLTLEKMGHIVLFENITNVAVKDYFENEDQIVYIVQKEDVGKAIGSGGKNIKILGSKLKRAIKVVGYEEEVNEFIKNLAYPIKISNIYKGEDNIINLKTDDYSSRGLLIGKRGKNLEMMQKIISQYHPVKLKVL